MKTNVGGADKFLRIFLGIIIIGAGFYFQTWWGAIGIIPIITSLIGWCPMYNIFGISTCKVKESK